MPFYMTPCKPQGHGALSQLCKRELLKDLLRRPSKRHYFVCRVLSLIGVAKTERASAASRGSGRCKTSPTEAPERSFAPPPTRPGFIYATGDFQIENSSFSIIDSVDFANQHVQQFDPTPHMHYYKANTATQGSGHIFATTVGKRPELEE
ncbi:hypothetical protein EJ05DRAFT_504596 [Pseudovirgaria hyperparasitica]|uniref:Uncharacterized protein n=1 Tax=Pseudovirgaria hyperparasitica TaxID=470096 RepID=A0A6A6VWB4_9PEZI|nr:uncharacterized protein EJ05DRAFT_504596 [Pseudovirgaria hyperparasitica]KAF2753994.1 hypothetical protein EJ05DRAFT_504596 [Pseudovirgaria hyperparasitica]